MHYVEYTLVMGLSILAFACSIDAFCGVYGCRDQALYDKLVQSENSSIRHYLCLNSSDPEDAEKQKAALQEIIDGVALERFDAFTYARSLVGVLHGIGEYLGSNGGSYGRQMDADDVLRRRGENRSALPQFDVRWPIGNMMVDDWPMVQTIRKSDVVRYAEIMTDLMSRLTQEDMGDATDSAYYFLLDLRDYYKSCAEKNEDIILVAL